MTCCEGKQYLTRNDGKNLPFVKARGWCPGVPEVVFTDGIRECATSAGELVIPVMFSTIDEVEDGMSGIYVDL